MTTERYRHIEAVVRALGPGEVSTYGDIAEVAGRPGRSRLVGHVLASGEVADLPWWRVVNSTGRLVPGAETEQAALLADEGVLVVGNRVRWAPVGRFSSAARSPARRPSAAC